MTTREQIFSCPSMPTPDAGNIPATSVKVFVIDDDASVCDALRESFATSGECVLVGEATCASDAQTRVGEAAPDVILLRDDLPGMSGLQLTRALMLRRPQPIIIMADLNGADCDTAFECLRSGALDIISRDSKDLASSETISRITAIARGAGKQASQDDRASTQRSAVLHQAGLLVLVAGKGALNSALRLLSSDVLPSTLPVLLAVDFAPSLFGAFVTWLDETLEQGARKVNLATATPLIAGKVNVANAASMPRLVTGENGSVCVAGMPDLPAGLAPASMGSSAFDLLLMSVPPDMAKSLLVVLFGHMGKGGAAGLLAVRRAGGQTLLEQPPFCPFATSSQVALMTEAGQGVGSVAELAAMISTEGR